jgi:hypothetical protein
MRPREALEFLVAQKLIDAVVADEAVAHLQHDEVGVARVEVLDQAFGVRPHLFVRRRHDAGVRKRGARRRAVLAHPAHVALEGRARQLGRRHVQAAPLGEAFDDLAGRRGLARIHRCTTYHHERSGVGERVGRFHGVILNARVAAPILVLGEHRAQHLHGQRLAQLRQVRGAAPDDAAEVQHVERVARVDGTRHASAVSFEGLPLAQNAHKHVALADAAEGAVGTFDLIVGFLVGEGAHSEAIALLGHYVVGERHARRRQFARSGAGSNSVRLEMASGGKGLRVHGLSRFRVGATR